MDVDMEQYENVNIKVVGVGDAGINVISRMVECGQFGAEFIAMDYSRFKEPTDTKVKLLQIGKNSIRGLDGSWDIVERQAKESFDDIVQALSGANMVFVVAGMGGTTGTGAAPIVAECAKAAGAEIIIGVVTKPCFFEGAKRHRIAAEGINRLKEKTDILLAISGDRILKMANMDVKKLTLPDVFKLFDDVMQQSVNSILDLIAKPGLLSFDFDDFVMVMKNSGLAQICIGFGNGENAVEKAAEAALQSPLLETSIGNMKKIILSIAAGSDAMIMNIAEAATIIQQAINPEAVMIFAISCDDSLQNEAIATVWAIGDNDYDAITAKAEL